MERFRKLFGPKTLTLIGMIHLKPLPGSPMFGGSMQKIIEEACKEAEIYKSCKIDSVMVENMHDIPYIRRQDFGPELISAMTTVCCEIKKILDPETPIGIQVLAGGNQEGIAIAKICGLNYIRAEGFVFSHIGDEGFIDATAGPLMRYRSQLNAQDILVFTDIKKKHSSHAITHDLSITDVAKAAEFFSSDGVIVTGASTGCPADIQQVKDIKSNVNIPVIVGSGVTLENINNYTDADAMIIGSYFKENGSWKNELSKEKIITLIEKVKKN